MIDIDRQSARKARATDMAKYIGELKSPQRPDLQKLHTNLKNCANYLVFHDYYTIEETRLVKSKTCKKHLLCPFCAARRGAKMLHQNLPKIESVIAENPARKLALVTLTVKNGHDLRERYQHLRRSLRKLNQRRTNALKGQQWTEWAKVAGAVRAVEITNKGQGWHPHAHLVVLLDDWIDRDALQEEWHEITGDSYLVDIRRIKPKQTEAGGLSIIDGLAECFKYAVKFSDMELDLTWQAYQVLKGKRLIDAFGVFRGIQLPESLTDDPLENLPYTELIYSYGFQKRSYELQEARHHPSAAG